MPGSKDILKKLDYNTLQIEEIKFLPPWFDGNCMFVLPLVGISSSLTKAISMDDMDMGKNLKPAPESNLLID